MPAAYKDESWARLGIDVDNDFKPLYVVTADTQGPDQESEGVVKDADELYLATDEDREGEAIAWHLLEVLNPRVPVKRMVFHEITPKAIREPSTTPASSTAAWSMPRRPAASSTGSTATRSRRCCGRRSCPGLRPAGCRASPPASSSSASANACASSRPRYWDLERDVPQVGELEDGEPRSFAATLIELDGKRVATGKDFDSQGGQQSDESSCSTRPRPAALADDLADSRLHGQLGRAPAVPPPARRRRS